MDDPQLARLDILVHLYSQIGILDSGHHRRHQRSGPCRPSEAPGNGRLGAWAIIDRSGALARAIYEEGLDADE
jgi:hypothetical protein